MEDLAIVSERQLVKGISRVIAVTGRQAKQVRKEKQISAESNFVGSCSGN